MLKQIRHSGQRGIENDLIIHKLKDSVDLIQPFGNGHVGVVDGFQVSNKGLKEVMMGVYQAGVYKFAGSVDGCIAGIRQICADFENARTLYQYIRVPIDSIVTITGDDGFGVSYHQGLFDGASFPSSGFVSIIEPIVTIGTTVPCVFPLFLLYGEKRMVCFGKGYEIE